MHSAAVARVSTSLELASSLVSIDNAIGMRLLGQAAQQQATLGRREWAAKGLGERTEGACAEAG